MKRRGQKRFFSVIFVPDQERDPVSITLSYSWGILFSILFVLLSAHLIFAIFGYVQWYRNKSINQKLLYKNETLKSQNAKVESIYQEFLEIKAMDERIRKAFGSTLGLQKQEDILKEYRPIKTGDQKPVLQVQESDNVEIREESNYKQGLYSLSRTKGDFFNPGYMPTLLPVDGYLTSHFQKGGWFLGRRHYGIDVAAELGTPIKAAGSGSIILSDWTPDFGNMVIISHGNGLFTYYGHASRLLVEQGHFVEKGDVIALLGNSGISSAPHLHFEIWNNKKPLDPELFLFAVQSRKK